MTSVLDGNEITRHPIAAEPEPTALAKVVGQREITEAQGAILLAQKFPRDEAQARERILIACQRPGLAEGAMYQYARGGTEITGPSIRLAEAIALEWGNLAFGIREVEQRPGESTMQAFAWDMQRNVRQERVFQVKHVRYSKRSGTYALDDPRDIYEVTANMGARRLRACILGLIPGDIVEDAIAECEKTLKAKADTSPEGIKKMVAAFAKLGVTKEQIERRLQRKVETITPAQIVGLQKIYTSLRDGMGVVADYFETPRENGERGPAPSGVAKAKEAVQQAAPLTSPTSAEAWSEERLDMEQQAGETASDEAVLVAISEQWKRLGYKSPQIKASLQAWALATGAPSPASASATKLTSEEKNAYLTWLKEQEGQE